MTELTCTADAPCDPFVTCQTGNYLGWMDILYCIEPVTCVYIGIAIALGLSILGAAWGILITGSSIMGTNIKMPFVQSKNLISVILCEATAIYGVIIALLLAIEVGGKNIDVYKDLETYQAAGLLFERRCGILTLQPQLCPPLHPLPHRLARHEHPHVRGN